MESLILNTGVDYQQALLAMLRDMYSGAPEDVINTDLFQIDARFRQVFKEMKNTGASRQELIHADKLFKQIVGTGIKLLMLAIHCNIIWDRLTDGKRFGMHVVISDRKLMLQKKRLS